MNNIPESIRAVLISPQERVLLMKIQGSRGTIWITPGGRREPGETAPETLRRELREETGFNLISDSQEIWVRHGTIFAEGGQLQERERFFYIPCEEFVPVTKSMEDTELSSFRGYRWWPVSEVKDSPDRFVPAKLGALLADLQLKSMKKQSIDSYGLTNF